MAFVLANLLPGWSNASSAHESSPNGHGLSVALKDTLLHRNKKYVASQYDFNTKCGDLIPGMEGHVLAVDLERQDCFPDESFDIVFTQDVLEHVHDAEKTFSEIARTLRPGGLHVFTVPTTSKQFGTFEAATRDSDGRVVLHAPAEVHGNPMGAGGSLLTRQWGYDIVDFIRNASGMVTNIIYVESEDLGIVDTEYREVFISQKAGTNPSFPHIGKYFRSSMGPCPERCYMCETARIQEVNTTADPI
jgi:SAM-dependent methyltransferase